VQNVLGIDDLQILYLIRGARSARTFPFIIKHHSVTLSASLFRLSDLHAGKCLDNKLHFKITVRVVLPEIVPEVAVMVVLPVVTDVTSPLLLTVATDGLDELQVTCVVISLIVPSE